MPDSPNTIVFDPNILVKTQPVEKESDASTAAGEYIKEVAETSTEKEILASASDKENEFKMEVKKEALESSHDEESSNEDHTLMNGFQRDLCMCSIHASPMKAIVVIHIFKNR